MRKVLTATACLAIAPALAAAQPVIGPYVSLGAGVNLQQDEIRHPIVIDGFNHFFSFSPGVASEFSVGYGLGYGFRVETDPLVPTAPGVREPQNRRVEIILK